MSIMVPPLMMPLAAETEKFVNPTCSALSIQFMPVNPSILAFKPRQLLLSNLNMNNNNNNKNVLKEEQKALVAVSIARYLENNGFTKTLKKFRSEAEIEKDKLNSSSPDLEEIFRNHFQACDNGGLDLKKQKLEEAEKDGDSEKAIKKNSNDVDSEATKPKKSKKDKNKSEPDEKSKKKKNNKLDSESLVNDDVELKQEIVSQENAKKKQTESDTAAPVEEQKVKSKSKKKKKEDSESLVNDDVELKQETVSEENGKKKQSESETDALVEDKKVKSKSKKKKKEDSENLSVKEEHEKLDEGKSEKKEGKSLKKRKREASEENENQNDEETKCGKTDEKPTEEAGKENNENSDVVANGNHEKSGEKPTKKQKYDSAENSSMFSQTAISFEAIIATSTFIMPPQTKRFQRVRVEEVEFADERLQDNSYWSKDGAENGYGAKAQEILGQVKGRGFRHEKTKKKRGSYRGGQIDLQSHSIKFQNSDDDE
ncbi:hypothetical protein ACFE04_027284 [Oxalis oulophora]